MTEADIAYENAPAWVHKDRAAKRYTVYVAGVTHSTSDSAYPLTADGLSIAKARADYLARLPRKAGPGAAPGMPGSFLPARGRL